MHFEESDELPDTIITEAPQFTFQKPVLDEPSTPLFALEADEVVSSRKKFQQNQREPILPSFSSSNDSSLFFVPNISLSNDRNPSRGRQSSRVILQPEEELLKRPKITSLPEDLAISILPKLPDEISNNSSKHLIERKPISMLHKLPIIPRPPIEPPKRILNIRGRSHQPNNPTQNRLPGSPPTRRKAESEVRSASPTLANKFRMKRFKNAEMPVFKIGKAFSNPAQPIIARHVNLSNVKAF